jgi:hypothetical protein
MNYGERATGFIRQACHILAELATAPSPHNPPGDRSRGQLPPNRGQPSWARQGRADGLIRLSDRIPAGGGHPIHHHVAGTRASAPPTKVRLADPAPAPAATGHAHPVPGEVASPNPTIASRTRPGPPCPCPCPRLPDGRVKGASGAAPRALRAPDRGRSQNPAAIRNREQNQARPEHSHRARDGALQCPS